MAIEFVGSFGIDASSFGVSLEYTHVVTPQVFTVSEVIYGPIISCEGAYGLMYYPAYVFGGSTAGAEVKAYLGTVTPPLNVLPNIEIITGETKQSVGKFTFATNDQYPFYIPLKYAVKYVKLAILATTPDSATMAGRFVLTGMHKHV